MPAMYFDAFTRYGPRKSAHSAQRWTLQHLVDEMRHCSISGALVTTTRCAMYDAMHENRRLVEEIADYDFLFPLWNVLPHWTEEFPEPEQLTKLMEQNNVRAVTLLPNTMDYQLESETARPLLSELQRTGTLCILPYPEIANALAVERLVALYPRLPILLREVPWGKGHSILPLLLRYKNVHLCFDFFQSNLALEWLVSKGCEDQLVYASNATDMAMGAHRAYVDWADVSETVRAKIAAGNLTRLLKGLKPPREIVNQDEDPIMAAVRHGQPIRETVYDMHAHILHEGLNGSGMAYFMHQGGPRGVRELARRMGVDQIGLMSWNGPVCADAASGNQCVTAALDAYPDFYWGLGTFDVIHDSPQVMRRDMEKLFTDPRYLGLKPYPSYGIPYDDPRYDCWWQFGSERKLYTCFHPVKWYQRDEFASVCQRFPDLTVVAYHSGGSFQIADTVIDLARKFPNFMIEITLTPSWMGMIDYLVQGAGVDRVMYGSDLPMRDPRPQLGWVAFSRLSYEDKQKVLGLNAKALIDRVRANQRQAVGAGAA